MRGREKEGERIRLMMQSGKKWGENESGKCKKMREGSTK